MRMAFFYLYGADEQKSDKKKQAQCHDFRYLHASHFPPSAESESQTGNFFEWGLRVKARV